MAKKTKADALVTRQAILDAAEIVFERAGVSRASLEDIAIGAGVTRGAVYCHFKNKADIFDAVMARVCEPFEARLNDIRHLYADDPFGRLSHLAFYFFESLVSNSQCLRVLRVAWHQCEYVGEIAEIRDSYLARADFFISVHEEAIRESCQRGFLSASLDPRKAAVGLMSTVYGLAASWTLEPSRFPLIEYGTWAIENYIRGMKSVKRGLGRLLAYPDRPSLAPVERRNNRQPHGGE